MRCSLHSFAGFLPAWFVQDAQLTYSVTDLGTLGVYASTAFGVGGQGPNAAGMIVGSSTTSDNSEHAFLFVNGQMFDLNTLCDLSQSDFKVLTLAKAINDSCVIIGEGITSNGDKHAFMLTPLSVQGGQSWSRCCEWVWVEEGGGWWWEENCGCQMARSARPAPAASSSPSMLVVSITLPTSLSPSESYAYTAAAISSLLVLHQRTGDRNDGGGMPREGRSVLPYQGRSDQILFEDVLVLHRWQSCPDDTEQSAGRKRVNAMVPGRKRSGIAQTSVGVALTEKLFMSLQRFAKREAASATPPEKKR